MSPTQSLISVEEYLSTSYRPDCDFVDGQVLERNMGETPHGNLQMFFGWYLFNHRDEWRVDASSEQRIEVAPFKFRIPDVCLISYDAPYERVLRTPPVLCIEILSIMDRMKSIQERLDDYSRMGVQCSWVIDPWRGTAFAAGPDAILHEVGSHKGQPILAVPNTPISIAVDDIFAELERLEKRPKSKSSER
jgi:Uma2 family endonuclease